jgi:hypothetical protein
MALHLKPSQERQGQVPLQMALVKLVEHDDLDAAEAGVREQPTPEDALGDEAKTGAGTRALFEANLVAHGFPESLASLLGHPGGSEPCCEATRLEHPNLSGLREAGVEQGRRHPRCLPRAGRGLQHHRRPCPQGSHNLR